MATLQNVRTPVAAQEQSSQRFQQVLIWLLTFACAALAANIYYIQPLLETIAHSFSVPESQVGLIVTATQLGFALGLLLLVPLGDAFNRKILISGTMLVLTLALIAVALAPSLPLLAAASVIMGATTVVTQMIVPFVALIARPEERGRAVGRVVSGLLIGTLLARTVSGFVNAALGWRAVYWIATALMAIVLVALYLTLPQAQSRTQLSYPSLLRSLWGLMRTERLLRDLVPFGVLASASFSAFWVTLTFFLSSPVYHFPSNIIGLFGLVGVVGALTASQVGKRADRQNPRTLTGLMLGAVLLSFVLFWLVGQWLWGLITGIILFDLGIQGAHVSNQTRIYARPQEIHSRLTTIYMFSYFVGGSLGAALGTFAWGIAGWYGVCTLGILLLSLALGVFFVRRHRE